ncbi:DUF4767 domain-containing protein [Lacticaseibacillus parahuelsenbergensis]|uniref:DUF4767 domain-containing protein n=1 Tax=Lacticaseibacillus parahuelsenbergensis TaxID=3068305 RepID=A0ABY9L3S6_9LACO|nr:MULTISPECIES: DUF4767 domain-containing protein [Lacticaseibacillus]MDE3281468.1 DUF4767 domain-containing protein [Lacticaseibacillus casei]WLV78386.1 DUF4767 domain-containing protein [Lacticaseibacillus sp. NCIMB 15471]
MKRLLFLAVIAVTVIFAGCSKTTSEQEQSSKARPKESITNRTQSTPTTSSKSSMKNLNTIWSPEKNTKLTAFMKDWQSNMGQSFKGTYASESITRLGEVFPGSLETQKTELVFDSFATLKWSTTGESNADYTVVAAAEGGKPNVVWPMLYLFVITKDNHALVLQTQTTNGDYLHFYETQNTMLQQGFAKIATENNNNVTASPNSSWHWNLDEGFRYLKAMHSSNEKIQVAADSTTEGPFFDAKMDDHGRTGRIVGPDGGGGWSLTKLDNGTTIAQQFDESSMPKGVWFLVRDSDHLILDFKNRPQ